MKLLTHNMLSSKCLKGVKVGYPLKLVASEQKVTPTEFNPEFVQRMMTKIDYPVLVDACTTLGVDIPIQPPELSDEESLKLVHHAIFEVEVMEGELICPETGKKFPIKQGIPNMLCNEDEI